MKTLSSPKMEGISGGYYPPISIDMACQAFAAAIVIMNGIPLGTDEAIIIYEIAYNSCLFG